MHEPISLVNQSTFTSSSLFQKTLASTLQFAKLPEGFERFKRSNKKLDPQQGTEKRAEKQTEKKTEEKKEENYQDKSKQETNNDKGSKGFGGPNMPNNQNMLGQIAGLAIAWFILSQLFGGETSNSREITWHDFQNKLLSKGLVERLVVVNKQTCYIYLKSNMAHAKGSIAGSDPMAEKYTFGEESGVSGYEEEDDYSFESDEKHKSPGYQNIVNAQPSIPSYFFSIGSVDAFEGKLEATQKELNIESSDFLPVQYVNKTNWFRELFKLAPALLSLAFLFFLMRGMGGAGGGIGGGGPGGIFKVGKSNAKKFDAEKSVKVRFKDVAGCEEAKLEIMEFVDFLKKPERFTKLGAKIPRGALLCGPPGTGKTMLAKAAAGEASVPFYSISGSDFIEMFVGVGASRVRDLFATARENAPCIIFVDEIDAVARARHKSGFGGGGNDERENTLNQLLVEMDGFSTSGKGKEVVVLGGTNRVDILDPAILRPGRFDRQIKVDLPDIKGRKEIFLVHLKELQTASDKEEIAKRMAALTPGFSGAQIANICNEAAILAARKIFKADKSGEKTEDMDLISDECFDKAVDRVIGGLEKNGKSMMSPEERKTVAYHEAGHAIAGWFLEHADPLLKVTIVPRMSGALGFAQYLPKEMALHSEAQLLDRMSMTLGGRAAEELTFGRHNVTTGAADDLDKVTKMAYNMIKVFGMNEKVGNVSFQPDNNAIVNEKPYSDKTAEIIDEEAKKLITESYERVKELLTEKQDGLKKVAEKLLEAETITQHDLADLIGPRPFKVPLNYEEFLNEKGSPA
eukprot:snap_masked-scaffold_14-processed-gene-5.48-mRNA-1 protein AED:0.23 eAED:0.23 QI:0/-1/0/1/-1/1/1/0/799